MLEKKNLEISHLSPDLEKQLVNSPSLGLSDLRHWKLLLQIMVFPTPKISPDESLTNEIHEEFQDLSLVLVEVTDLVTGSIPFRTVTGQTSLGFV